CYLYLRVLHSFPTRRSSDLSPIIRTGFSFLIDGELLSQSFEVIDHLPFRLVVTIEQSSADISILDVIQGSCQAKIAFIAPRILRRVSNIKIRQKAVKIVCFAISIGDRKGDGDKLDIVIFQHLATGGKGKETDRLAIGIVADQYDVEIRIQKIDHQLRDRSRPTGGDEDDFVETD